MTDNVELRKKAIVGYRDTRYKCGWCRHLGGKELHDEEWAGWFCNKHQFPVSYDGCCDGWEPDRDG